MLNLYRVEQFMSRLYIRDRDTGIQTPFRMRRSQQKVFEMCREHMDQNGRLFLIFLKARRLGLSTLAEALLTAHCISKANARAMIVAQLRETAHEMFELAEDFAGQLPFQLPKPTKSRLTFPVGGRMSTLRQATANTVVGGRGLTLSAIHMTEAAFYPGEDSFVSILNTVSKDPDNIVVIETTANGMEGPGEAYYNYWNDAVRGENEFLPIFLPWHEDPESILPEELAKDAPRDEYERWLMREFKLDKRYIAWFRNTLSTKCAGDINRWRAEYPACVTAETRVSTEHGIIPIHTARDARITESGAVLRWGPQPEADIWELRTSAGRLLRGTYDHPVMTTEGWCGLSSLSVGTRIVLRPPRFALHEYVASWNPVPSATLSVPITDSWARLLGYIAGDGCWYKGQLDICCDAQDQDVVADVSGLMDTLLGGHRLKQITRIKGRKGCTVVRLSVLRDSEGRSRTLPILRGLGVIDYYDSCDSLRRIVDVYDCIWRSPKAIVRSFLSALFECDGSCARDGRVGFYTKHDHFARSVQLLLLGFGIPVHIESVCKTAGNGKMYLGNRLRLSREASELFHERIGFISARKRGARKGRHGTRPLPPVILEDSVASVAQKGREITYDFTVEGEHAFSAEGILTHNTPEEAFIATGTPAFDYQEQEIARRAIKKPIKRGYIELRDNGETAFIPSGNGPLFLYEDPQPGHHYFGGIDAAKGSEAEGDDEEGDFAASVGWNAETGDIAWRYSAHVSPHELSGVVNAIGRRFNKAMLNVELTGGWGYIVMKELRDTHHYPNQYMWRSRDDSMDTKGRKSFGFDTNDNTRRKMFDLYRTALRRHECNPCDQVFVQQMSRAKMEMGWRWRIRKGHDDVFMAGLLGWIAKEQYHTPHDIGVTRSRVLATAADGGNENDEDQQALPKWMRDPYTTAMGMSMQTNAEHFDKIMRYNRQAAKGQKNRLEGI